MGLVGGVAAAAVALGVGLLSSGGPGTPAGPSTPATVVAEVASRTPVPAPARPAAAALVALVVTVPGGQRSGTAVAVASGGYLVTTADLVAGATGLSARAPGAGPVTATVVATDQSSDVALVRVPVSLSPPAFADDGGTRAGSAALVMASVAASSAAPVWSHCTVEQVAGGVPAGPAKGMAAITASAAAPTDVAGAALVDRRGAVVGLLDQSAGRAGSTTGVRTELFLPATLMVAVAGDLRQRGGVDHGWLDLQGIDAPHGGALVKTVEHQGAAQGRLDPGDVVAALGGHPVRTMAELRARLYALPPGTAVVLRVERGGRWRAVGVTLAGRP
jgi:S1-C subfamily serine protease